MSCPKSNVLATEQEILNGCETFEGIPLAHLTEDQFVIVAIGHHSPERFLAALAAMARDRGWDPRDLGLYEATAESAAQARGWSLIYRHADRATAEEPELHAADWCVCHESPWWIVESGVGDEATPTMWWEAE